MENKVDRLVWKRLCRKNRVRTFFGQAPTVSSSYDRVTIQESHYRFGVSCALVTAWLGVFTVFYLIFLRGRFTISINTMVLLFLAMILVTVGILAYPSVRKISWNPHECMLNIHYGSYLFPRTLSVYRDRLRAKICKDNSSGSTLLALFHADFDRDDGLNIAVSPFKSYLVPVFEAISNFLRGRASDEAIVDFRLAGGKNLRISTTPISTTREPHARAMKLRFPSPDRAVLGASFNQYIFWLFIFGFGVWLYSTSVFEPDPDGSFWHQWLRLFIVGSFLIVGLIGLSVGFRLRKITLDKIDNTLTIQPGILGLRGTRARYSFDEIAALQLCQREDLYEFNLVLIQPPDARINISTDSNKISIKKNADKFAKFLGKPLLDHTGGVKLTT